MQLMKQNGIQVNNNNSNSAERLSAQQHSPARAAAPARGLSLHDGHYYDIFDVKEEKFGKLVCLLRVRWKSASSLRLHIKWREISNFPWSFQQMNLFPNE